MVVRNFMPKHNITALLNPDAPDAHGFQQIIKFLLRSRIFYAISHSPTICLTHVESFWQNADYDCKRDPPVITTTVDEHQISVSVDTIRTALQFEDQNGDPTMFPSAIRIGAFSKMGYSGDFKDTQMRKSKLAGQWRYLMHVLIMCLSSRKGGSDGLKAALQSAMVALTLNKPYNFSQFVFDEMVRQLKAAGKDFFLLYPRFVQIVINHLVPNLSTNVATVKVAEMDKRIFADCRSNRRALAPNLQPVVTELFGHLIDESYVASPDDGWNDAVHNPDSDSDNEASDDVDGNEGNDDDKDDDNDDDHDKVKVQLRQVGSRFNRVPPSKSTSRKRSVRQCYQRTKTTTTTTTTTTSEATSVISTTAVPVVPASISMILPTSTVSVTYVEATSVTPTSLPTSTTGVCTPLAVSSMSQREGFVGLSPFKYINLSTPQSSSIPSFRDNDLRVSLLQGQVTCLTSMVTSQGQVLHDSLSMNQMQEKILLSHEHQIASQQTEISELKMLVSSLMKRLDAQGEISGACKENELKRREDEDKGDDPEAPKDGEHQSSSNDEATTAGASAQGASSMSKQGDGDDGGRDQAIRG